MATQNSKPSGPVGSPTTPTGEESVTPDSQPSGLGALSASMSTEPERKTEAIQRAQIGSLMGANGNNKPQNKLTPARAYTQPLRKTHTVLILPSTVSIEPTPGVLVCT